MITANNNRRFQFAVTHHFVKRQPGAVTFTQAQPANTRRQPLEGNALTRHVQPVDQIGVVREEFFEFRVGLIDIFRVAGKGNPTEWPFAFTEQRADVGRDKTREIKGVFNALFFGDLADIVAVIEGGDPHMVKIEHGLDMFCHRSAGGFHHGLRI
ncbi:Uncharacterised protein [Klebsiella variicola]|nr:Uncharacterised protein [Klebsiella variicola]